MCIHSCIDVCALLGRAETLKIIEFMPVNDNIYHHIMVMSNK